MGWRRIRGFPRRRGDANQDMTPDWRDAQAYAPLLEAGRSLFAWEWLRRNPVIGRPPNGRLHGATGGRATPKAAERWGLHEFEQPAAGRRDARPIWRAGVHPFVLGLEAVRREAGMTVRSWRASPRSRRSFRPDLVVSISLSPTGFAPIRVDILRRFTLKAGPVPAPLPNLRLGRRRDAAASTLRRFLALWRTGRFCRSN